MSVLLCNFVGKTQLCSFGWLYLSSCIALMFVISVESGHHSCFISADWSHHSQVIIVWSHHFTKDDWWTKATTESTNHQKVEATNFVETHEVKKATSFEKLYEMKKEKKERTSETANCISVQKWRYILCRKTLFTTKRKTQKNIDLRCWNTNLSDRRKAP